jgi:hypothetical protein
MHYLGVVSNKYQVKSERETVAYPWPDTKLTRRQ